MLNLGNYSLGPFSFVAQVSCVYFELPSFGRRTITASVSVHGSDPRDEESLSTTNEIVDSCFENSERTPSGSRLGQAP